VPAHTGLINRTRLPITESHKIVELYEFKPRLNVLKDQQSRELRIIRTAYPALYVYDNTNEYTSIRPLRNEEQKVDNEKKRFHARMAVLQSLISP